MDGRNSARSHHGRWKKAQRTPLGFRAHGRRKSPQALFWRSAEGGFKVQDLIIALSTAPGALFCRASVRVCVSVRLCTCDFSVPPRLFFMIDRPYIQSRSIFFCRFDEQPFAPIIHLLPSTVCSVCLAIQKIILTK